MINTMKQKYYEFKHYYNVANIYTMTKTTSVQLTELNLKVGIPTTIDTVV